MPLQDDLYPKQIQEYNLSKQNKLKQNKTKQSPIYLSEASVQCHCRMICILSQVQVRGTSELFFNNQSLLQKLEPTGQELILDLQEVAFAHVHLERLIDNAEPMIVLDILPATISMGDNACKRK